MGEGDQVLWRQGGVITAKACHSGAPERSGGEPGSILPDLWLWIPGSRPAAEPRNDWTRVLSQHAWSVRREGSPKSYAEGGCRLARGAATSRAQSTKSCATGLMVRFFRAMTATENGAIGSSIGNLLSAKRLV